MQTALSTISVLPSDKLEVAQFVRKLKSEILAADKDPLKILVQLKFIEKTIKEILTDEDIDNHFLNEFLLYDKDEKVTISGAELRSGETGVKYDYAASGDLKWIDMDKQINDLTEQRKKREKLLIALDEKGMVDPDNGLFINRPPKSSKTKVIVKL
jgi:Ca2+-binding EF-hand superfamily protein